ncbi:MAG: hypothetical protein F2527_00760, partial [Actinobacteria bacterium]|nr:hypothetical protein [Actinomycetota bacterium]
MISTFTEFRPWTDPTVVSIGRLAMRQVMTAHIDVESARGLRQESPWWQNLNGSWQLKLWANPDAVPNTAVKTTLSSKAGWLSVEVPGNWTMQGTGDLPHYTNVQ